ncbi:hypothetical protein D3C87_1446070 [compost metagenome]
MVRQFNAVDEVRKHPGITAGVVAVLAGVGIAVLLLNQRSGPTRYERIRERVDPRGWFDAEALRHRFDDIARGVRHGADGLTHRAADLGDYASDRADRWLHRSGGKSRKPMKRYAKQARRYAEDAGDFARDHAKEGGALLAVATIAAAIGAAALESRRKGEGSRGFGKL